MMIDELQRLKNVEGNKNLFVSNIEESEISK